MAFRPGFRAYVGLDNAGGSLQNLSAYFDDVSLPYSTEMLETTTFGSSVKRFIAGLSGGDTVSLSGPMDVTVVSHIGSCLAAQAAGTAGFSFEYGPGGSVAGQPKQTCEVLIAGFEPSTGVGGRAELSLTLQIDGAVTTATY